MRLNVLTYQYRDHDGYGRFANRLIGALVRQGVAIAPSLAEMTGAPAWLAAMAGLDWAAPTLSILPPYYLRSTPAGAPHWLLSMTEGDQLPAGWADAINASNVERVLVPCRHNAEVFAAGGVRAAITVIPGGTDPAEFPVITEWPARPFTFLALADRGARKGWSEVWAAFYREFGDRERWPDVRLLIKAKDDANTTLNMIAGAQNLDPRVTIIREERDPLELYRGCDCFVIPSRSEGWGMPHREAAMMGIPVIVQAYAGVDDGYTSQWAIPVYGGTLEPIPAEFTHIAGRWLRADVGALAAAMRAIYDDPTYYRARGRLAAQWLRDYQTWDHAAGALLAAMKGANVWR